MENARINVDHLYEGSIDLIAARLETRGVAPGDYLLVGTLGADDAESVLPTQIKGLSEAAPVAAKVQGQAGAVALRSGFHAKEPRRGPSRSFSLPAFRSERNHS